MIWPESILILDPAWAVVDGPPGCDGKNVPQTAQGWAELEIRATPNNPHRIDMMIQIWQYRHQCLMAVQAKCRNTYSLLAVQAKCRNTYSLLDVYNASWASMGYTNDMPKQAIELAKKRFNPENGV